MRQLLLFPVVFFLGISQTLAAPAIPFTVNLSENVTVTGTPRVAVDVGGQTRYATYTSGSGTTALTFTLSPQAGDVDLDGIAVSSPIDLNGGTMKDAAGNNATLTFTPPNTSGIKVSYPSLGMDFVYDADGRYTLNGTVYNDLTGFLTAAGGTFSRASVGTYFDSTGTLQTASSGAPRFDWDPVTHAARGILIEESRTNIISNSTGTGAVAGVIGSGGALPTGWAFTGVGLTGITRTISIGTESGIPYIDIRFFGSSSSGGVINTVFGGSGTATASGQSWANSVYMRLVGGSTTNTSGWRLLQDSANSSNVYVETKSTVFSPPTAGTLASSRYTHMTTFSNASTAKTGSTYFQFIATTSPIDVTVRFGLPQTEFGTFVTSAVPTSSGAITRAMDNLTMPTGTWHNASAGTAFVNAHKAVGQPVSARYFGLMGGNSQASIINSMTGTNLVYAYATDSSGTSVVNMPSASTISYDSIFSAAYAFADNDFSFSINGSSILADTTGSFLSFSSLTIGNSSSLGARALNGWVRNFKYYPARVPDAQLLLLSQ